MKSINRFREEHGRIHNCTLCDKFLEGIVEEIKERIKYYERLQLTSLYPDQHEDLIKELKYIVGKKPIIFRDKEVYIKQVSS